MKRSMKRKALTTYALIRSIALSSCALVAVVAVAWQGEGQDAKTPYPKMAPVDQYMMERSAEIALGLSAAPPSISGDAGVLVIGPHGDETAGEGKNGFLCVVEEA